MKVKAKKQITIIYPPTVDYNLLAQRPHHLLKAMSKISNVRTIFLNSEAYQKQENPIMEIKKDFYVVGGGANYKDLVKGKVVFWCSYPDHINFPLQVNKDYVVFDAIDNPVEEFSYWSKNLKEAVDKANMISTTANILYDYHTEHSNKPVFLCPNGGDYTHFKQAKKRMEKPEDMPPVSNGDKVIGFYGAMASWLDIDIINKIADKYKVVLIGNNKYYNLHLTHPNVYCIDHKKYSQLPQYLSHFDMSMIPFKLTEMMKGCDPCKLQEYLSSGKPVISTEIEDVKKNFGDVVDFINKDNCLEVIEGIFKNNNSKKEKERMKVAQNNSWDNRAAIAIENINKYLL